MNSGYFLGRGAAAQRPGRYQYRYAGSTTGKKIEDHAAKIKKSVKRRS
jgi:hypothetical protein